MKHLQVIAIFISLVITSCNQEKTEYQEVNSVKLFSDLYHNDSITRILTDKIINKGDTLAFIEMKNIYLISGHNKEFLYYAMYMASEYEYPEAYNTVYFIMHSDNPKDKDKYLNKLSNYYLLKAHESGYKNIDDLLDQRFPDGIPTSQEYLREIN